MFLFSAEEIYSHLSWQAICSALSSDQFTACRPGAHRDCSSARPLKTTPPSGLAHALLVYLVCAVLLHPTSQFPGVFIACDIRSCPGGPTAEEEKDRRRVNDFHVLEMRSEPPCSQLPYLCSVGAYSGEVCMHNVSTTPRAEWRGQHVACDEAMMHEAATTYWCTHRLL